MKQGFTLIEVLIVIAIAAIILGVVGGTFYDVIKSQALKNDYISVVSLLDRAKSLSINAKSDSEYGVRFASTTAQLFKGSYSTANVQETLNLNSRTYISNINLSSGSEISFDRLTGYASAYGTISVALKNSSTTPKVVKVYQTGVIEHE